MGTFSLSRVDAARADLFQNVPTNGTSRRAMIRQGAGLAFGAVAAVRLNSGFAAAQDATPGPQVTVEETKALLDEYLGVLVSDGDFGQYYADDIVVVLEDIGQEVHGKDPAIKAIKDLHQVAFTARPEIGPMVVGAGVAGLEVVFVGTHTGEFSGIPATNRAVRVPYAVFYGVANQKITALRIYSLVAGLLLQLAAPRTPATPAA